MKKLIIFLMTTVLFSSIALGQIEIKSYRLGLGINKSLTFPSGEHELESQGLQPKINCILNIGTSFKNLEFQIGTSVEKVDCSRPFLYGPHRPMSRTPLPIQVKANGTLIGADLGLNYDLIKMKSWTFSTMGAFGLIGSFDMKKEGFYDYNGSSEIYQTNPFVFINVGFAGLLQYQLSDKYSLGFSFGINKYYNFRLRNLNHDAGYPTPNNFQIMITRKINN